MIAKARSASLLGVSGHGVSVEAHVGNGLPCFNVVGLPDASCREARDRVRAALLSSKFKWPGRRVTVNLAPTHVRKVGSGLDLAIAVAVLAADEQISPDSLDGLAFLGELGLDGKVRGVVGVLPLVDSMGPHIPVVSLDSLDEAHLIRPDAHAVGSLAELVDVLSGDESWRSVPPRLTRTQPDSVGPDLADVVGQLLPRTALEVAAAGGHHLLMVGPPGAGKTMLAERLPGLLPDLTDREALDVSQVHSAAGLLRNSAALVRRPPLRAPHHTASLVALVGGGSNALRPGEISLASGGVLFLDELGEFPAAHLDALRQPLESGSIQLARATASVELPARFLLVGATNPCPCGVGSWGECQCSQAQLTRYSRRLSGPLLDRFDMRLPVDPPDPAGAFGPVSDAESSSSVRERVACARARARSRGVRSNRELRGEQLEAHAPLGGGARDLLLDRLESGTITMRGAQRVRAVALTMRDLAGVEGPLQADDVAQALMFRGDRGLIGAAA